MSKQALDGSRINAFGMDPDRLVIPGIDTDDGPEHPLWQPRLATLKSTITEEWVASLATYGVLQAVDVRKNGGRVEVVLGRRRVLGLRVVNERRRAAGQPIFLVTCLIYRADDKKSAGAVIAENEGRVDDSPIVKTKNVQRLLEMGYNAAGIATAMCTTEAEVERLMKILDLADDVQALIAGRRISVSAALTLRDLPRDEQVKKAEEYATIGVTVEAAKAQTKARKNGHSEPVSSAPSKSTLKKLANDVDFFADLEPQTKALLRWILSGDEGQAKAVKGLTAKLRELG